ncbi:MAG: AAA family ATPase [Gammaproteobacteria bacterium]|nr:AAA family ATPase [Gammaproteobacteria bacterium]
MLEVEQEQKQPTHTDTLAHHPVSQDNNTALMTEETPYLPPSWEHYLDLLQDLCHHRNTLVAITAPAGAGKTTLMCQFIELIHNGDLTHAVTHSESLSSNLHICNSIYAQTCQVFAHTDLDKYHLLALITEGFNLPPAADGPIDKQLITQINYLQTLPHLCLLLIDNAENLPAETISALLMLIHHQSNTHMQLHIMLFGSPTLQTTLNIFSQDELHAAALLSLPLTPFSLDETKKYIEQQLEKNTFPATANLTTPIVETIYKLSEGIPAKINNIAPRLLMASEHIKTGNTMNYLDKLRLNQTKLIGGLLIITLIFSFSYYLNKRSNTPSSLPETSLAINDDSLEKKNKDLQTELAIQHQQLVVTAPALADPNVLALHPNTNTTPPLPVPDTHTSLSDNNSPAATATPETTSPNTTQVASAAEPTVNINNKPLSMTPVSAVTTKKKQQHATSNTAKSDTYTSDERYLLNIGADNYTIQLVSAPQSKTIRKILNEHHLGRHAHYFSTLEDNKPAMALVYGTYSSYDAAQAEIQNLPEALQKLNPEVKNFKKIHGEIRQAALNTPALG